MHHPTAFVTLAGTRNSKTQTWDVSECLGDAVVAEVDDEWTFSLDAASISHFSFSCTEPLGAVNLIT